MHTYYKMLEKLVVNIKTNECSAIIPQSLLNAFLCFENEKYEERFIIPNAIAP